MASFYESIGKAVATVNCKTGCMFKSNESCPSSYAQTCKEGAKVAAIIELLAHFGLDRSSIKTIEVVFE